MQVIGNTAQSGLNTTTAILAFPNEEIAPRELLLLKTKQEVVCPAEKS